MKPLHPGHITAAERLAEIAGILADGLMRLRARQSSPLSPDCGESSLDCFGRIPISIRRRGGRKLVLAPDGTTDTWAAPCRRIDNAMVKAIARAFRWRGLLENGTHATIAEIAAAEKINASYVSRVLRPTVLAPDIVEAILGGRQPAEVTLAALMRPFPVGWREQMKKCLRPQ